MFNVGINSGAMQISQSFEEKSLHHTVCSVMQCQDKGSGERYFNQLRLLGDEAEEGFNDNQAKPDCTGRSSRCRARPSQTSSAQETWTTGQTSVSKEEMLAT